MGGWVDEGDGDRATTPLAFVYARRRDCLLNESNQRRERGRESQGLKGEEEGTAQGAPGGEVEKMEMETGTETEPGALGFSLRRNFFFFFFIIKQSGSGSGPAETLAVPGRRGETPRVAAQACL